MQTLNLNTCICDKEQVKKKYLQISDISINKMQQSISALRIGSHKVQWVPLRD